MKRLRALVVAGLVLAAQGARASEARGMYLCQTPVAANDFFSDLKTVRQAGLTITPEVASQVAGKHLCGFAASTKLRPVEHYWDLFKLRDGANEGWAAIDLYVEYVR